MAIYSPNNITPKGLKYVWNYLGSSLKGFAQALCPYLKEIGCAPPYTLHYGEMTLTSQQIQNDLYYENIVLLPHPGPGKFILFHEVTLEYTAGTTPYDLGTNNEIYISNSGIKFHKFILESASDQFAVSMDYSTFVTETKPNAARSYPYLMNTTDPYYISAENSCNNGDGTLKIKYYYSIRTFG